MLYLTCTMIFSVDLTRYEVSRANDLGLCDGWIICDFTSFLTVFQSYQDSERLIMKGCEQWNPIYS